MFAKHCQSSVFAATSGLKHVDISLFLQSILNVKDPQELLCVKAASTIAAQVLQKKMIPQLETVIDAEKNVTHASLANTFHKLLLNPKKLGSKVAVMHKIINFVA